jgi:hypothetical protein
MPLRGGGGPRSGGFHGGVGGFHSGSGSPRFIPGRRAHYGMQPPLRLDTGAMWPINFNNPLYSDIGPYDYDQLYVPQEPPYYLIGKTMLFLGQKPIELTIRGKITLAELNNYVSESSIPRPYLITHQDSTMYGYDPERLKIIINDRNQITDLFYG